MFIDASKRSSRRSDLLSEVFGASEILSYERRLHGPPFLSNLYGHICKT